MGLMLFGFFYFSSQSSQKLKEQQANKKEVVSPTPDENPATQDSLKTQSEEVEEISDSLREAQMQDKYSDFWRLASGKNDTLTFKTEKFTVNISKKGGKIVSAYLNTYKTYDSLPLPIVAPNAQNEFNIQFPFNNRALNTKDLYFEPQQESFTLSGDDEKELVMRAALDDGRYLDQVYTFKGDNYDLGYKIRMKGLKEGLGKVTFYEMNWKSHIPKTEYDIKNMRAKIGMVYKMGGDVDKINPSDDTEKEKLPSLVEWISFKSQFFSQIMKPEEPLRSATVTMSTPENEEVARIMDARMIIELDQRSEVEDQFLMYMGPNEYTTLVSYKSDFQQQMDLGWSFISWINKGTTYVFKFLEKYIDSYGLIIIILAIMIRLMVLPLSFKSYVSMARMRVINQTPEVKAIDEKYKDDQQKQMMAKQNLYKEMGVSMFGGCLPMLLSYPFLIALFFFFPQSVELRQQPFLWAEDLSTYDSIISWKANIPIISNILGNHLSLFTLLMAISTFIYTYFSQQSQPSTGANSQFKMIAYIMPVFLLFFLNSYASGLSLYYLTSNILQITQTTVIRNFFVNDEKLLAEMRENQKQKQSKKKGKKGGKGGGGNKSRLERWVEKQQKKQEQMMKDRQKQGGGNNRQSRRKK